MSDPIPSADAPFDDSLTHFVSTAAINPAAYGLTAADVSALQAQQVLWKAAYQKSKDTEIAAKQATQAKNITRAATEALLRSTVQKVNAKPGITNAERAALDLPAHKETRTKIGAPETRPVARIVDRGAHRQEVHWVDETTPLSRAKPHGVHACELWLKIGDPAPLDETTCIRVAEDTATPYLYEFQIGDVGKNAYWLLRWVSPHGETGPLGLVASAKING